MDVDGPGFTQSAPGDLDAAPIEFKVPQTPVKPSPAGKANLILDSGARVRILFSCFLPNFI